MRAAQTRARAQSDARVLASQVPPRNAVSFALHELHRRGHGNEVVGQEGGGCEQAEHCQEVEGGTKQGRDKRHETVALARRAGEVVVEHVGTHRDDEACVCERARRDLLICSFLRHVRGVSQSFVDQYAIRW